jgi:hypothetical protein
MVGSVLAAGTANAGSGSGSAIHEPKYGFSLKLPSQWNKLPLDGSDITSLLNTATHNDPTLANALSTEVRQATKQGIKVFAIGPLLAGSVPNVSIATESSAGSPSGSVFPPAAAVQAKISLAQAGAEQIETSVVHNRLGSAAQVRYTLPLKTGTVHGVQFYVRHTSRIVIITVTTLKAASSQSAARVMVNSWRWN